MVGTSSGGWGPAPSIAHINFTSFSPELYFFGRSLQAAPEGCRVTQTPPTPPLTSMLFFLCPSRLLDQAPALGRMAPFLFKYVAYRLSLFYQAFIKTNPAQN